MAPCLCRDSCLSTHLGCWSVAHVFALTALTCAPPQSFAPFTGTWRPVQRMSFLFDGTQTSEWRMFRVCIVLSWS